MKKLLVLADVPHFGSVAHLKLGKIFSLAVILMVLFTSGQRLYSQWELIDTVWTSVYRYDFDSDFLSPNDSISKSSNNKGRLFYTETGIKIDEPNFLDTLGFAKSHINCFMSDTTILVIRNLTATNNSTYDTAKVYDFKNHRYMGIYDIKNLAIPYNQHTFNKNFYSRYDNCLYGFTQKMNMTTGEISNLTDWYYLHGYSISPDGTILAGYEWYPINDGKYGCAQKFISLVTGELIYQDEPNYNGPGAEYPTGTYDYYFSDDMHYVSINGGIFDFHTKKYLNLPIVAGTDENGMKYSYSRPIISKSSKAVLSFRYYRGNVQYGMLDSIMISVIDLATQKETLYPLYIEGMVLGTPKAFVFDDYHIICDGACKWEKQIKGYYGCNHLGSSCMLKLKFDVNGVSTEPEEIESVIYPNPTNGEAIIKFIEPINFPTHLQVSNANGEIVFIDELQVGILEYRLNTLGWQSGTYYIMTSTETGSKTYKLILNK